MNRILTTAIAALLLALPQWLLSQNHNPALPDSLTHRTAPEFSFLTCSPGSIFYELEGHSALRVITPDGEDITVNWGLFDFDSPNFLYRFVKGETDYVAGAAPTQLFLESYRRQRRSVVEQKLDLTPDEASRLLDLIAENLQPANRTYRYNYVLDNCATRPLRMIEKAIGDTLTLSEPSPTANFEQPTFRRAMRSYHHNYPWYQFGIDLALGSGIDRPVSQRMMSFAPEALEKMLSGATRTTPSGETKRIVLTTATLVEASPGGGPLPETPFWLSPTAVCWTLFLLGAALSIADLRRHKLSRWFDTTLSAATGTVGLVIAFLVFISVHESTSPNWLLLWLNPLAFIPAICIWLKKAKRVLICYQIVNFAIILTLLVVWALGVQSLNPAFLPLILLALMRSATYLKLTKW